MTDWEKQLGRRATAVDRAKEALDTDIAAARLDGHSFREIGRWAGVNHERARGIAARINGDSRTRVERAEQTAVNERTSREVAKLDWYYGPTDWDQEHGRMWHRDCPAGRGEVMYDKDGSAYCLGCGAYQEPEDEPLVRPGEEPTP